MYQIVIVDDEPKICEGIVNLFPWNQLGFQVAACFENGREALNYINKTEAIHVVMTDIQMPVMNGIELSQNLINRDIIVIFFSGYQDFEYARSAIINHVTDYLIKPMKYEAMVACFERVKNMLDAKHPAPSSESSSEHSPYHTHLVETIKAYIEENYQSASLEEASLLVHFSTTYLSSSFKAKAGISFSDYLLQVRMEKALELLNDINYKQYEIADKIGYTNPKNMTRNFKEYYGITPYEYRLGKSIIDKN